MKRRQILLLAGVCALVLLNTWRYWPKTEVQAGARVAASARAQALKAEEFVLRVLPAVEVAPMLRDIFQPQAVVTTRGARTPATPAPPLKSAEEIEKETAQAELMQIKCVGIVSRGGRAQAFLLIDGQSVVATEGDKVGGRFVVNKVMSESVILGDPRTQVVGEVVVSGN